MDFIFSACSQVRQWAIEAFSSSVYVFYRVLRCAESLFASSTDVGLASRNLWGRLHK